VIYQTQDDVLLVLVVRIGDRKEIYKRISELLRRKLASGKNRQARINAAEDEQLKKESSSI
jgi:hypothetical protein